MPAFPPIRFFRLLAFWLTLDGSVFADDTSGKLLLIGGGLLPNNSAVFDRLIADAGGPERARFGIFPTASKTSAAAKRFSAQLAARGIPEDRIHILDVTFENAKEQAESPAIVEQVRACTAIYFSGGDQSRISRALLRSDGSDTAVLAAVREVWRRGGLVAGSSAGAAAQSETMISVSGLPDEALDEGMGPLDYGLSANPLRRGLLATHGLGFFRGGIIDQHFSQYRGRLGRLARATIEKRVRFGFGIDENTALAVAPDGSFEVIGLGSVTIVDASAAKCVDGPLGCRISGLAVSLLQTGDRFDSASGVATPHSDKKPIVAGKETNSGNFLLPDVSGTAAVQQALIQGLADNTSRRQVGVTLSHHGHHSHGYKFTFEETKDSRAYEGTVSGFYSYSVLGIRLDIEPVDSALRSPAASLPLDLPSGPSRKAIEALLFRGILLADQQNRFRPYEPVTRAEFASALARTIHLVPARKGPPEISDIPSTSPAFEDISLIVSTGLMTVDDRRAFRPRVPVSRRDAASALLATAKRSGSSPFGRGQGEGVGLLRASGPTVTLPRRPRRGHSTFAADHVPREEAAEALYKVIGFPW